MGYCVRQVDSKFKVKIEDFPAVIDSLREHLNKVNMSGWYDKTEIINMTTIHEMLEEIGWSVKYDLNMNITDIEFENEKFWESDKAVVLAFAPFAEAGSFIEMLGEDGAKWRYVFDGNSMKEVQAKTVWED
jgi:hypothetical protein